MGRTATGGITLQDEAVGDTTTRHDDGVWRHDDDSNGAAAADNNVDNDDKDVNNANIDNQEERWLRQDKDGGGGDGRRFCGDTHINQTDHGEGRW